MSLKETEDESCGLIMVDSELLPFNVELYGKTGLRSASSIVPVAFELTG